MSDRVIVPCPLCGKVWLMRTREDAGPFCQCDDNVVEAELSSHLVMFEVVRVGPLYEPAAWIGWHDEPGDELSDDELEQECFRWE